jgi:outer membrane lipoprotein-sorting protein
MLNRTQIIIITLFVILVSSQAFGQNANDEIMAAFSKLDGIKSYRIKTSLTPSGQYAQQMEMVKQMGMDMVMKPMVQEVVNPNLRKITMDVPVLSTGGMPSMSNMEDMKNMPQSMPPTGGMQMKAYRMKMYGVSNGSGMATYLDCPECQKAIDDSMRQQMREYLKSLTMSLLRSIAGGPQSAIAPAITSLIAPALQESVGRMMIEQEEKAASLNQWTCRNVKVEKADKTSPPNLMNAKATGNATIDGEKAKTYIFSVVDEQSKKEMPMTLYVSASSGLPLKIEMSQPQGSMSMEYYDINAPIKIDVPECMKK